MKKLALSTNLQKALLNLPSRKVDEGAAIYADVVVAEKIPIKYSNAIHDKRYNERVIYESYKAKNLHCIMDYMNFCLRFRSTLPTIITTYKSTIENNKAEAAMHKSIVTDFFQSENVSDELKSYYNADMKGNLPVQVDQEKILIFDSNFESGNLDRVSINSFNEYNLFLNPDTNTKGHSQWFYFAVTNTRKGEKVIFNVLNCTKPIELFKKGLSPLVFSEMNYEDNKIEWSQDTYDVTYSRGLIMRKEESLNDKKDVSRYYALRFSYEFKYTGDKVYFAFGRPYTLGMHFALLDKVRSDLSERNAKITVIEDNTLQEKIKQFINTSVEPKATEESPLKRRGRKSVIKKDVPTLKEHPYISSELLKEFNEATIQPYEWMRSEEFQAESEGIVYKQEILCRSFCGIPIVLLTITSPK